MSQKNQASSLTGNLFPGILFSFLIAFIAKILEGLLPVDFIGASVIALFIGILWNALQPIEQTVLQEGVTFTSKRGLKLAIILLGASLNLATIFEVGQITLIVLFFSLINRIWRRLFVGESIRLRLATFWFNFFWNGDLRGFSYCGRFSHY